MAVFRLYPTQDTFVTNLATTAPVAASASGNSATGSNAGASEILQLFKFGPTGLNGLVAQSMTFGHVLVQFSTSTLPSTGTATASFFLSLFDAQHEQTIPAGVTAEIIPLEQAWSEGNGHDLELFTDTGVASWISATLSTAWVVPGAAPSGTVSATFFFQTGHEDLLADVTALATAAFGYFIRLMSSTLEADANDYYLKEFHSRQTHFPAKRPFLEVRWTDWTGSLSTSSFFLVTASNSPWSGTYIDPRLSGTISGTLVSVTNSLINPTVPLAISIFDLKPAYDQNEVVNFRLYTRPKDFNLSIFQTASFTASVVATASAAPSGAVLMDAYYRVVDDTTGMELVPFGTGAGVPTKLSFDDNGNYFKFYMQNLPSGSVCRFDIGYQISGSWTVYRGDEFKFRIGR